MQSSWNQLSTLLPSLAFRFLSAAFAAGAGADARAETG